MFAAGIYFGFYPVLNKFIVIFSVCIIALFIAVRHVNAGRFKRILAICVVFFIAGSSCFFFHSNKKNELLTHIGKEITISAIVTSITKKDEGRYQLTVKTAKEKEKILVNIYGGFEAQGFEKRYGNIAGRCVEITGKPELPSERRNPGMFDYRLYLKTKGIDVAMNIMPFDFVVADDGVNIFLNTISNIRHDFSGKITSAMKPENAGIFLGMLLGDKTYIEDEVYEIFQKNGTAHILAVSGLHVGIVYMMISKLINARRNLFLNLLLLLFLFIYVALAAFSPSALRAGSMIGLHIMSKMLHMRYDMLSAAAAVALLMMIVNPWAIFDLGFQLSFLAILILAIALPFVQRFYSGGITVVFTLQAGLAPVTAYIFNYFSVSAFIINIPVILLAGIIIPAGIILIPLSYLPPALFSHAAGFSGALCGIIYGLNEFTYAKAGLFYNALSPPLSAVFMFYGLLFFGCSEMAWILYKRRKRRIITGVLLAVVILSFIAAAPAANEFKKAQLIFIDVGQGDCLHIRAPGGKNILIDGGGSRDYDVGKKILLPYLLKNGVRKIDMAFVSHRHLDHYGGLVSLAKNFDIDKMCFYEGNKAIEDEILSETGLKKEQILYLVKGQVVEVAKDIWIEVLYPERKADDEYEWLTGENADENEISLILKVYCQGVSVLMTGDINTEGEERLINACAGYSSLKSDFLKVSHHGSKYSSGEEFLREVNPKFAIIQVGKNGFGHPTAEVLDKCEEIGARIYRNDRQGAIGVFINKENLRIKTVISIEK